MTHDEAIRTLKNGGSLVLLAEAIGVVASDPQSSLEEIMLGLSHHGFVQEQAALALYRRTCQNLPDDRKQLRLTKDAWSPFVHDWESREHSSKRLLRHGERELALSANNLARLLILSTVVLPILSLGLLIVAWCVPIVSPEWAQTAALGALTVICIQTSLVSLRFLVEKKLDGYSKLRDEKR